MRRRAPILGMRFDAAAICCSAVFHAAGTFDKVACLWRAGGQTRADLVGHSHSTGRPKSQPPIFPELEVR
jgi:hypothetical protein